MEKTCRKCSVPKPVTEFHKTAINKDGLHNYCKPCARGLRVEYLKTHRPKALAQGALYREANYGRIAERIRLKGQSRFQLLASWKTGPCMDCGKPYEQPYCMEFDHRDRSSKILGVSRMSGTWPIERIKAEVAKCDLVCRNCHRIRTKKSHPKVPGGEGSDQLKHKRKVRAWLDSLKANPCMDCGNSYPPECMDWDHVRGEKYREISRLLSHRRETIEAELAKCDLVCACCHAIRTHTQDQHKFRKMSA